ncbi:MAG TPA: hypothetical protein VG276_03925 [Actinomycetes bacterium]|jgi:tetratricopeptide (TPR) repeat protein|nr:hypothetical protein [Actinomycetes bacterium]
MPIEREDNLLLREQRELRDWSLGEAAGHLREVMLAMGDKQAGVNANMWWRWERGMRRPERRYRRGLCRLFGLPADHLGLPTSEERASVRRRPLVTSSVEDGQYNTETVAAGEDWTADAVELMRQTEQSDIGPDTLETIDRIVDRFCRDYSSTMPVVLRREVLKQLRYVGQLLQGRLTIAQRRHLLVSAGWLALLLACLHFDVGDRTAAEANRGVAFHLGRQADHHDLMAWALETKAWFSLADGSYRDAIEAARAGEAFAPAGASALVALTLQQARAWARRGDKWETERAIRRATKEMDKTPAPAHPEHHFVFDAPKLSFYAATSFVLLGEPDPAEEHANRVIEECSDPERPNYWPTRVATTQVELGMILGLRGEVDGAAEVGAKAFDSAFLRTSTLWRAAELDRLLMSRYADVPEARDFHEQHVLARRSLTRSGAAKG